MSHFLKQTLDENTIHVPCKMMSLTYTHTHKKKKKNKTQEKVFSLLAYRVVEEGNGNPLQYSCLENLMDGGAW